MTLNEIAGWDAARVIRRLTGLSGPKAPRRQWVSAALSASGFLVSRQYEVSFYTGYTFQKGHVSIVAAKGGGLVAIELDRSRPRISSVGKLNSMPAYRILTLRGVICPAPKGIDEVIAL